MKFKVQDALRFNVKRFFISACAVFIGVINSVSVAQTIGTIGVGDIRYSAPKQTLLPQENVLSSIGGNLNSALIGTRKFTVLDYPQLEQRLTAQGLNLEGFYTKSYQSTELQQIGLDYILTAEVVKFGLFEQPRGAATDAIGLVDIDYKLLGVADATEGFESNVSAQTRVRVAKGSTADKDAILDQAIKQAVGQLVDQVISSLHPIRVMKIADNSVITLNYGEGLLAAGDTILVYPKDQEIKVGASGEPLGQAIATLQVIDTQKKFATAQAVDGFDKLEKGQKGQLLLTGG